MQAQSGANAAFLQAVLDAMPSFVMVVDDDVRVIAYNAAAATILTPEHQDVLRHRGGEVMHCLHATDVPAGCGRGPHCPNCVIRNSVNDAVAGKASVRRRAHLELHYAGQLHDLYALISATPFSYEGTQLVLLVIEDITQMMELQSLVPICMRCGKIRDDGEYWVRVEAFFKNHLDLDFSHSYCPDCLKKELEQVEAWASGRRGEAGAGRAEGG